MLNNISWQGYWITLALLSAGYYLVIYLLYYRIDFKVLLPRNTDLKHSGNNSTSLAFVQKSSDQSSLIGEESGSEISMPSTYSDEHLVYACMDELNAYFEEAKREKCVKEEFIYSLQRILQKYPTLKSSHYKESIMSVIISEAEHICSIHLKEDDVVQVWLD